MATISAKYTIEQRYGDFLNDRQIPKTDPKHITSNGSVASSIMEYDDFCEYNKKPTVLKQHDASIILLENMLTYVWHGIIDIVTLLRRSDNVDYLVLKSSCMDTDIDTDTDNACVNVKIFIPHLEALYADEWYCDFFKKHEGEANKFFIQKTRVKMTDFIIGFIQDEYAIEKNHFFFEACFRLYEQKVLIMQLQNSARSLIRYEQNLIRREHAIQVAEAAIKARNQSFE